MQAPPTRYHGRIRDRLVAVCGILGLTLLVSIGGAGAPVRANSTLQQTDSRAGRYQIIVHFLETITSLTNLCTSTEDPAPEAQRLSVDRTIRPFRDVYRVDPRKLMLGSTMYGRGWKGVGNAANGLYQEAGGSAPGIEEAGANRYRNLVPLLGQGYVEYWDPRANAPWMWDRSDGIFWTYDNRRSLRLKAEYVKRHGLGGMLVWEISGDTPDGALIQAIHSTLRDSHLPKSGPCD